MGPGLGIDKPVFRLGQALIQLQCFSAAGQVLAWSLEKECRALSKEIEACAFRAAGGACEAEHVLRAPGQVASTEFVGNVEAVELPGKGRGLKATNVIATNAEAASQLVRVASADIALRRRLEVLYDGTGKSLPLVSLKSMLQRLDLECAPFLLPPDPDFVGQPNGLDFSASQAKQVLNFNCHGGGWRKNKPKSLAQLQEMIHTVKMDNSSAGTDVPDARYTAMYSGVAFLNHSSKANAVVVPVGPDSSDLVAVVASRNIAIGEEITISYSSNPDVLKTQWGIVAE